MSSWRRCKYLRDLELHWGKNTIQVQSALLWISQPDFQNQSITDKPRRFLDRVNKFFPYQPHLPCTTGKFDQYTEKKWDFPLNPIKTSLSGKVICKGGQYDL